MGSVALGFSQSNKSPFSFGEGRGGDEVSYVLPPPAQGTAFKDCGLEQAFGKFCLSPCIMAPNLAKIRRDAANVLNRQLSVRSLLRGLHTVPLKREKHQSPPWVKICEFMFRNAQVLIERAAH